MLLGTMELERRHRPRRTARTRDCPFCGAIVVVRTHDDGGAGLTCRCCGWWRIERADGRGLEESLEFLRQRHGPARADATIS